MHNFKFLSIRNKFFYAMFASSSIVIFIICIITNIIFISFFIKEQKASSFQTLNHIAKQLESLITSTENYSKTIITSPIVQETTLQYKQNQTIASDTFFTPVKDELNHIIQSTPYIHSVSLYGFDGEFLTSTLYTNLSESILTKGTFQEKAWLASQKPLKTDKNTLLNTFSCVRPFFSYDTGEHLGYLEIAILESSIAELYQDSTSNYNQFFIIDAQGKIQSSRSNITMGQFYPLFQSIPSTQTTSYTSTHNTFLFTQYVPLLNWYIINAKSTYFFFQPIHSLIWICMGIAVLCILLYIPLAQLLARTITSPLQKLITHTQTIMEGQWTPLENVQSDEDVHALLIAFNSMVQSQEKLKNKLLTAQHAKDQLALDLLQEQINPHFLYNTLDNICALAEIGEIDSLIHIVMNLSTFYRRALSNGKTFITIREELELTEAYLHILKIRYFDLFNFEIICSDHILNLPCLKLLLQPIVENSIYHGIKELPYKGLLTIHVKEESDAIIFVVRDNGVGIDEAKIHKLFCETSNHFGIQNIHQRIQLHYGIQYGLTLTNHPEGGCITTIRISKKGGPIYATECSYC